MTAIPADVQMTSEDVDYVVAWEKANNFKLNLAFNASGACTAPAAGDESKAICNGETTINGQSYADPGQATDSSAPNDSAMVNELLANQGSFNWITHTWSHNFLGCFAWQPMVINTPSASSGGSLAPGSYYYEVTAATAYGESEPSAAANAVVVAPQDAVDLTWADATNGGGPSLSKLESEFGGGSGFWGYNVYRSTSATGPFGLIGQVAEDATGETSTYHFTDAGTATPGGSPSSTSYPTATNPGIECATGGWYPATSTTPDSSIDQEIGLDVAFAQANGLSNFSPSAVVTGEHSGLENPNMPTAMADMGITTFAADASRQPKQYTITGTSGSNSVTAYSAPRYPTNIYYNASTWDEELNEYNTLYVAQGVSIDSPGNPNETGRCVDTSSTTCLTTPASEADVLASESRIELGHVLNNDPRVTFAHQSNLTFPDYTLLSLLSDVLAQYNSWYSTATPYVQTTDVSSSQILSEQAAWATAEAANTVSAVASDGTETVTNGGKSAIAVPITAPTGSTALGEAFGSPYGDSLSAWETLAPGASVTIGVPGIPQTITFSTPPTDAVVNGTPSAISATGGGSGNPVVLSVDALSTAICSLADGAVSYLSIGTCVIDATQAGNLYSRPRRPARASRSGASPRRSPSPLPRPMPSLTGPPTRSAPAEEARASRSCSVSTPRARRSARSPTAP